MIIPLSLIGLFPDAQAQTVTATITGDPFTIGESGDELRIGLFDRGLVVTFGSHTSQLVFDSSTIFNSTVDPSSQILNIVPDDSGVVKSIIIDLDTTLGELQQTIDSTKQNNFQYNVTELTTTNGNTNIFLVIYDNQVFSASDDSDGLSGLSVINAIPLVRNGDSQGIVNLILDQRLNNTDFTNRNIGLTIEFDNRIRLNGGEQYPISADFTTFESDGTPINHITRQSVDITPAQQTTYQNLLNAIAARQTAIDQQNVIVDYWTNSNNPFADDRTLAQDRIDYANSHITQSTIQRDSYQAQLDQILNP